MAVGSSIRDVGHLVRLAILLFGLMATFWIARSFLIPEDFGVYGHFRASALDDNRARPLRYAGRAACLECHDDVAEARAGGGHQQIGCESCHEALKAHADDPTEVVPERPQVVDLCLRCHQHSNYRPADFPQIEPADHAGDESCDACHQPHHPDVS